MTKKHNSYPLDQSPFYKLQNRKKLCNLLITTPKKLNSLLKRNDNYYEFDRVEKLGKVRRIEAPRKRLELLHHRIFILLARIEVPNYLQSGTKGRSHITNAKKHIGNDELISLDIKKFYPSTKGWHVYDFFHNVMKCSPDIAAILKDIAIYNDHVPTGSCLSQKIAFFAHYELFNDIDKLSTEFNLTFTCFVDDINLSGKFASKFHLNKVRVMLKHRGLQSHPKKERLYKKHQPKVVTGSIVTTLGLKLPNIKHYDIHAQIQENKELTDSKIKLKKLNSIKGKLVAGSQSDPSLAKNVRAVTCEINSLKKIVNK